MSTIKYPILLTIATLFLLLIGWLGGRAPALYATQEQSLFQAKTADATPQQPVGRLRFIDNETARTGSFALEITWMDTPPAGNHYELWLRSDTGAPLLDLGSLKLVNQQVNFNGQTKQPLLNLYNTALISLQPDKVTALSQQIVLSSTLPAPLLNSLRPLFFPSKLNEKGFLSGATEQIAIGIKHTGFLHDALGNNDFTKAQQHAEHIVNLLDGKDGPNFYDWNRNGTSDNPGDGFGVRAYLEGAKGQIVAASNVLSTTAVLQDLQTQAKSALAAVDEGHKVVQDAEDKALKVFSADTVAEAQAIANELTPMMEATKIDITTALTATLQMAEFRFYAKAGTKPLSVSNPLTATQSVRFAEPANGATVPPKFAVKMAATGLKVEPAGEIREGVGHMHIMVDTDFVTPGDVIISDEQHKHFGQGQLTTILELKPGLHVLRLQFGNGAHIALDGLEYRDTITVTVVSTATQAPLPTLTPPAAPALTQPVTPTLAPLPTTVGLTQTITPTAGEIWLNPTDGAEYVYVPDGEFTLGVDKAQAISPLEQPAHQVTTAGFWLQRTEVTNAEYGRCVAAKACTPPTNQRWNQATYAEHPVTDVSWVQANAYAAWAGGRLPSEAEWEKACRSTDARPFPWGTQPPTAKLANYNNQIGDTTAVGSYPDGASPYGALDMAGNVWEWTTSLEQSYPYDAKDGREDPKATGKRILRGGSFYYTQYQLHCTTRSGFVPTTANKHFGLRVVMPSLPTEWTNPTDNAVYVYVPDGEFTLGVDKAQAISPLEQPAHQVTTAGFWLQRTEVTNAEYGRCVAAKACTPPTNQRWNQATYAEHPVTDVSWVQANAYAAWAGGRLPSEAEWEKACRSTDARPFPWGTQPPTAKLANYNNQIGDTTAVGSYPDGASPYGALDMAGNVWEWTTSLEQSYPYDAKDGREDPKATGKRILRGGSFYYTQYQLHCTTRSGFVPTTANKHFGLRVIASLTGNKQK